MNTIKIFACLLCITILPSYSQKEKIASVLVKNTLDKERSFETIELTKEFLKVKDISSIGIRDSETGQLSITQIVDNDGDGIMDKILFQPIVAAKSDKSYEIVLISEKDRPKAIDICYSRFVPERTDDYAWENDKVAFRVYGPAAQKMVEDNIKGGTLSSGVDAWLKKVEYPIINKWYKKSTEGTGSYHKDTGEGLDNFHVGTSRGVGGIAVKNDSKYYISKNYTKYRTITTGPIRTSFYLEYENWDAGGKLIKESRIISLDLGSNLSKFEISLEGIDEIYAGLTLHEKDGEVSADKTKGWVNYWQPHGDSELGTVIIASPEIFLNFEKYITEEKDLSNVYAHLKVKNNKVVYYAGFGWRESRQFKNSQEWENYLDNVAEKLSNPMTVSLFY